AVSILATRLEESRSDATIFFFQAEDGIRDGHVTGVQTCALPISLCSATMQDRSRCCPDETVKRYVSTIRYPNRELSPFASRWTASVIQEAGRYRSPFCNDGPALGPVDSCTTLDLMNRPTEVGGIRRTVTNLLIFH